MSGIVVGPRAPFIGSPSLSQPRGTESPSSLLHSLLFSSLARRTSRVRSPADLRSYIYCIEETRAAAFLAHAPPVMSGLQSPVCLSVRLSGGPVDRSPSMPPTRPFSRGPPSCSSSFSATAASARYSSLARLPRYSISSLSTGTLVHIQIRADRVAPFLRNLFRNRMTDFSSFPSFF